MNVVDAVERAARFFPERPAIRFEGASLPYRALRDRSAQLAGGLASAAIGRGDRVALFLPNLPEFAIAYLAVLRVGAIAVSVSAASRERELSFLLEDSGAVAIFTTRELVAQLDRPRALALRHVIFVDEDLPEWEERGAPARIAAMDPEDPAVLLYTSGTTGRPKGATLSHCNVVSNAHATCHHAGYRADDRMILFLPLFHCFGQNFVMNATFTACATLVLHRRFIAEAALASIAAERVTMLFAVPTIYIQLLGMDLSGYDLSSLRYEFSAAATLPAEIGRRWLERWRRPIWEGYGLTECSPFACYNHDLAHRVGSVGAPIENTEICVVDEEEHQVPIGALGEICIRGPGVMRGYWNRPLESARALRGGWLHSGDIGRLDEDGYLYLVDRVKDMINCAGLKVWPAEVEEELYRHPSVQEAAVYGVADPVRGERVAAAVVLRGPTTAEELRAHLARSLSSYKVPERIDLVAELPKSPTGKVLKRVLRDGSHR